jgi:hypothetical protein
MHHWDRRIAARQLHKRADRFISIGGWLMICGMLPALLPASPLWLLLVGVGASLAGLLAWLASAFFRVRANKYDV